MLQKNAKNLIFHFQMIKLLCKVVSINNIERQSCLSKCLEGNRDKMLEIDAFYQIFK